MRCDKAKKILSDYLDRTLSRRKTTQLEAHLGECSDCAKELEELRKLSLALQNAGRVEASEEYWENYWIRLKSKLPQSLTLASFPSKWTYACIEFLRKPVPVIYTIFIVLLIGALVIFLGGKVGVFSERKKGDIYLSDFYLDKHDERFMEESRPDVTKSIDASRREVSIKTGLAESKPVIADKESFSAKPSQMEREMVKKEKEERTRERKGESPMMQRGRRDRDLAFGRWDGEEEPARRGTDIKPKTAGMSGIPTRDNVIDKSEIHASLGQDDLKGTSVELYGLIVRILKLKGPKNELKKQPLIVNVPKGDDLDSIFLAELRKANSKAGMNFDFLLSSKAVTIADRQVSVSFRSGDLDYTLKIKPEGKGKLSYSANYFEKQALLKAESNGVRHITLPQIGETVMLKLPASNFTSNNLIVLLTRFEPLD